MHDIKKVKTTYGSMWISNKDSTIGVHLERTGNFEEHMVSDVVRFLKRIGFTPKTFIDIGANIGTHLVYALSKIPFQNGIGFEPDPLNFGLLEKNIECNGLCNKVRLFNFALSDRSADATLALSDTNYGDHRIYLQDPIEKKDIELEERKKITVATHRFDDFAYKNDIKTDANTLIWMDVQGHEAHVIDGFNKLDKADQPFVVMEFSPNVLDQSGRKKILLQYFEDCEAVYDLRTKNWWKNPSSLSIKQINDIYDNLLKIKDPLKIQHTDLLCIPKGRVIKKSRWIFLKHICRSINLFFGYTK
jgi:FkbM family methyltransferase